MSGGDRSVDDETTEHPVASGWPATFAPPAGGNGDALIAIIWLGAHGFVVAALAVAGDHFQPVYPPR